MSLMKKSASVFVLFALALMAQQQHKTTLTWTYTDSTGTGAVPATGFRIYRSTTSGQYGATPLVTINDPAARTYVDQAGLVEGQKFFYIGRTIGLVNGVLTESVNSPEASGTTPFFPIPPIAIQTLSVVAQ